MAVTWSSLPEDVKRIIVEPLSRIDKGSLRQCSLDDQLFIDSIFRPIRELQFIANRGYIRIRYDEEYEDFFENNGDGITVVRRSKNFREFTQFSINGDFQFIAWRSFQNMLKFQKNQIETLKMSFVGSLDFNKEWNEPERIIPNLPEDTVSVKNLEVTGDCPDEILHKIVGFVKPSLDFLNTWVKVKDLSTVSRVGGMEQMKTAKKVVKSLIQLTFEQSMELEAEEIVNKTKGLTEENYVELLNKTLSTGKPSKFTYSPFYPDPQKIVENFDSVVQWSADTAEHFQRLRGNSKIDSEENNKNQFIISSPERSIFLEITKFLIEGFVIKN
ncbi:unnamed protein product [Caenorhabditis brenneri]